MAEPAGFPCRPAAGRREATGAGAARARWRLLGQVGGARGRGGAVLPGWRRGSEEGAPRPARGGGRHAEGTRWDSGSFRSWFDTWRCCWTWLAQLVANACLLTPCSLSSNSTGKWGAIQLGALKIVFYLTVACPAVQPCLAGAMGARCWGERSSKWSPQHSW